MFWKQFNHNAAKAYQKWFMARDFTVVKACSFCQQDMGINFKFPQNGGCLHA